MECDGIERVQVCPRRLAGERFASRPRTAHLPTRARGERDRLRDKGYRLRDERGWTLIEALVVTGIILIMSAIAVPQYAALASQMRASAAATALLGDINYARAMSVRTGIPHYVVVTGGAGVNYRVQREAAPPAIVPGTDPVVRNEQLGTSLKNVQFSLAGAATDPYGNPASAATPVGQIAFDLRGLPSQAGTYFIATSDNQNSYAVTITGAGRARIWKKTGGSWH